MNSNKKSNRKIEAKSTFLTHKYMTAHFPGLSQALQNLIANIRK